jgi:hypothetical protein
MERHKMKNIRVILAVLIVFIVSPNVHAQSKKLTASEAKDHVGEHATVCGHVASTRYSTRTKGQPTFLNLDEPYPRQIFTIVIWGDDRSKFGTPEATYSEKNVCVTATISEYRGTPEAVATNPGQISIQ